MSQYFTFLKDNNIDIFYNIYSSYMSEELFDTISYDNFINKIKSLKINSETSFYMIDNDIPIGFLLSTTKKKSSYISSIIVLKEFRSKGYGQILLQKGISLLLENGCNNAILEVLQDNTNAVNFYKKEGFLITNELLNLRNESSSFYKKNTLSDYNILLKNNFSFSILYNNFKKSKNIPWHNNLDILLWKIKNEENNLFIIEKKNNICGYVLTLIKDNLTEIVDIGLYDYEYDNLSYFLSKIIYYSENDLIKINNKKIVYVKNLYADNPIVDYFIKNGFYIDIKQYEMRKKLL